MSDLESNGVVVRHSSESNEHFTPDAIVEAARATLGDIDLDPASCSEANERIRALVFFDAARNGFGRSWSGRVFLNPPGGKMDPDGRPLRKLAGKGSGFAYEDDGEVCSKPSESSAKAWWFKLAREYEERRVTSAVFIGFSVELLQSTQVDPASGLRLPLDCSLCFPSRRIAYLRDDGSVGESPPHASVIVHLCDDVVEKLRFKIAFSKIGHVVLQGVT